jgi:hypothetical protein
MSAATDAKDQNSALIPLKVATGDAKAAVERHVRAAQVSAKEAQSHAPIDPSGAVKVERSGTFRSVLC